MDPRSGRSAGGGAPRPSPPRPWLRSTLVGAVVGLLAAVAVVAVMAAMVDLGDPWVVAGAIGFGGTAIGAAFGPIVHAEGRRVQGRSVASAEPVVSPPMADDSVDDHHDHPDLEVEVDRSTDPAVVSVAGEIDAHTAEILERHLDEVVGTTAIVLDVGGVAFIDSSGLRVLIQAHKQAADTGTRITLRGPSGTFRRLLDITGLEDVFDVEAPPDPA